MAVSWIALGVILGLGLAVGAVYSVFWVIGGGNAFRAKSVPPAPQETPEWESSLDELGR